MKFILCLGLALFFVSIGSTASYAGTGNEADYCTRLIEISTLPRDKERIDDVAYKVLIDAGDKAIPCLIESITDITKMEDPRCPKFTDGFTVGDMAYFMLARIAGFTIVEMLPTETQKLFKTEGMYAYHWFVEKEGNRQWLQDRLNEWYSQRKPQEDE